MPASSCARLKRNLVIFEIDDVKTRGQNGWKMVHLWFGLAVLLASTPALSAPTTKLPVKIDLRWHRGEIRNALLRYTPLGTQVKEVVALITKQFPENGNDTVLKPQPATNKSLPAATEVVRVFLGQYYDHPEVVFYSTPLFMQREVRAQWWFNKEHRLIDIVIEKKNGVY